MAVLMVENKLKRKRNASKPSRYLEYLEEDDLSQFVTKPKSTRGKKKPSRKNSKKKVPCIPSSSNVDNDSDDPRDKLLKEFAIKIMDKHDEEMIKRIPYWNPVLKLEKLSQHSIEAYKRSVRQNMLYVKEDSLCKGMVKKTICLKGVKTATVQNSVCEAPSVGKNGKKQSVSEQRKSSTHKKQSVSTQKAPVRKTLGIRRRKREQSGDVSDSSNASAASHGYSMRTKRTRVTYTDDDYLDEILNLTDRSQLDDGIDAGDDDSDASNTNLKQSQRKLYDGLSRLSEPSDPPKSKGNAILHRKFASKLSLGRKYKVKGKSSSSETQLETDNDSIPDITERTSLEDDEVEIIENDRSSAASSYGSKDTIESDPISTGNDEDLVSPNLFEDTIISPQSTAEASRCDQAEAVGVGALPEKEVCGSAARPSQDNCRSRIYNSLPGSPLRAEAAHRSLSIEIEPCSARFNKQEVWGSQIKAKPKRQEDLGPPMFSITTDDSKDEYRDAMWSLSYFSPLRPDPEPSPPRIWSPTHPSGKEEEDLPWLDGNNSEPKRNSDILKDLACIDSDQMMKEMAEFQRDHIDLFQNYPCQPHENPLVESNAKISLDGSQSTRSKDGSEALMDFDVVPDSQSEEDLSGKGEAKNAASRGEPNNNIAAVGGNPDETVPSSQSADDSKVPEWTLQQEAEAVKKYEPMKPLEIRGDPSKKVIGTVHPTQHVKPPDYTHEKQVEAESNKATDNKCNIDTKAIKSRTYSISAGLKSPLDVEPSSALPSSGDISLMSPTFQPAGIFQVQRQNQKEVDMPKDAQSLDNIDNIHTSVLTSEGEYKSSRQDEEDVNLKEQATLGTQHSDDSSPLTPGQRQQESRHSPTQPSQTLSDSDDSSERKSNSPIDFDFLISQDEKLTTVGELTSNADDSTALSTEPTSGCNISDNTDWEGETTMNDVSTAWKVFNDDLMTPVKASSADSASMHDGSDSESNDR